MLPDEFAVVATPALAVPGLDAARHLIVMQRSPAEGRQRDDAHHRGGQPEGRRGQDDHRRQSRREPGRDEAARAAGRPRSAGQRDDGFGPRQARASRQPCIKRCWASAGSRTCAWRRRRAASISCRRIANSPARRSSWSICPNAKRGLKDALVRKRCVADEGRDQSKSRTDYDFILLDCPPSLSLLTLNGAVRGGLRADPDAVRVLRARRTVGPDPDLEEGARASQSARWKSRGLLRTMYDPRNTLALNVTAELEKHFGEKLYRTIIPRNIRLCRSAVARHPGVQAGTAIERRARVSRARRRNAAPDRSARCRRPLAARRERIGSGMER